MSNKLYIVMPAYNEAENIQDVVQQWIPVVKRIGNESKLVIFDDGSKDNTYERMTELSKEYPDFIPETKPNSGHGATCLYAYHYALNHGADYIFQTDSDGQTNPDEFWIFWENRENYDFLIGQRSQREDGSSRIFVTRVLRIIIKLCFGVGVKDANTPFRLMKRKNLSQYLEIIPENYFLSNVIMSVIAVKKNEKIFWHQISFKSRQKGTNSINLKRIFKIGLKSVSDFREINKGIKKSLKTN